MKEIIKAFATHVSVKLFDKYMEGNKLPYIITPNAKQWDSSDVICRDEIVENLLKRLQEDNAHIQITGMGGIGKTAILNKVFIKLIENKEKSPFGHIGLIEYNDLFEQDLMQSLYYPPDYNGEDGFEAAKSYLQTLCNKKKVVLLIDDNRKNQNRLPPASFFNFLSSLRLSIVYASRMPMKDFTKYPVDFLSFNDCKQIFLKQSKISDCLSDADKEILAKIIGLRAGYNTLLVNRLGVITKDHNWTLRQLEERLERKKFNIIKAVDDSEKLQAEINKLYDITEITNLTEKNILEAFSIFPQTSLKDDICVQWLCKDAGLDEDECKLYLNKLANLTWLEQRKMPPNRAEAYTMHQMVSEAVKGQDHININAHITLIEQCTKALSPEDEDTFHNSAFYIPFAVGLCEYFCDEKNNVIAKLAFCLACYFHNNTLYADAMKWYRKALEIFEEIAETNYLDIANTYIKIADVYRLQGKYEQALDIYYKILDQNSPNKATVFNNIAIVYDEVGQYEKALEWYEKALEIFEKTSEAPYLVATVYNNIAGIYKYTGKYEEALKWYKRAKELFEEALQTNHPSVAIIYNNIAEAYDALEEYETALQWYKKALVRKREVLGEGHPSTAATYTNIASVYQCQQKHKDALMMYKKSLKVYEDTLGNAHPETANLYNNLAVVCNSLKEYEEALKWCDEALAVKKEKLGENHPHVAIIYNNKGAVYTKQGNDQEALKWYTMALTIKEKTLGKDHPSTVATRKTIKGIYNTMEDSFH